MKRLLAILVVTIMLGLTACGDDDVELVSVNVEGMQTVQPQPPVGIKALVEIGNNLWYDQSTRIVYFWNGLLVGYRCDTTPSPYYASNGLPYLYNPETNAFELIEE